MNIKKQIILDDKDYERLVHDANLSNDEIKSKIASALTTERRGQGGQKQTHNEKSILIYQYGILVIKLRSGKVSGNRLCLSRDSITSLGNFKSFRI